MSESEEKVCVFIKKRRNVQLRSKDTDDSLSCSRNQASRSNNSDNEQESETNADQQQQPAEKRPVDEASESENSDTDVNENLNELKRKFKAKSSLLTQSTKQAATAKKLKEDLLTKFSAEKNPARTGPDDMGATSVFTLDTEFDRDARAIFERAKKIHEEQKSNPNDDKVYRGVNNYQQFIQNRETAQGAAFNAKGPKRAPANLRVKFVLLIIYSFMSIFIINFPKRIFLIYYFEHLLIFCC